MKHHRQRRGPRAVGRQRHRFGRPKRCRAGLVGVSGRGGDGEVGEAGGGDAGDIILGGLNDWDLGMGVFGVLNILGWDPKFYSGLNI